MAGQTLKKMVASQEEQTSNLLVSFKDQTRFGAISEENSNNSGDSSGGWRMPLDEKAKVLNRNSLLRS